VIVISQDCDVVQGNCQVEPAVEIVVATSLPNGLERRHQQLRDPRLLHVELRRRDGKEPIAISAWARGAIARELLLETPPDETVWLREEDLQDLVDFISRRYERDAFPEEFARRFGEGFEKLRSLFRANHQKILQIYLRVEPFEELVRYNPEQEDDQRHYNVDIWVLVSDALLDDKAALAAFRSSELHKVIRSIRQKCAGIDVELAPVVGQDGMTVGHVKKLRRVDLAAEQAVVASRMADAAEGAATPAPAPRVQTAESGCEEPSLPPRGD